VVPLGAFKLVIVAMLAVVGGATAVYTALYGPRARARKRLAAGTSTIEDHTIVTLTGIVRARTTLEAPLSGTPCVAFLALGVATHGGRYDERTPIAKQEIVPFELVTDDGVVLVDTASADIVHEPRSLIPRDIERQTKFLVEHGFDARMLRTSSFQQVAIADGDKIAVQGLALVEQVPPSDASGYRDTERTIRLVAHDSHPLTIGPAR
jgi:hypothetical protein